MRDDLEYQDKDLMIALQGGGAHGAFSWGVLDRLLEVPNLHLTGFSGTSAGAINAALMAYGYMIDGKDGAKAKLNEFWDRLAKLGETTLVQPTWYDRLMNPGEVYTSPGYMFLNVVTELFSPYQFNPLDINPLRELLSELIDFEVLSKCEHTKLFITATNVKTCKARVFKTEEMSVEVLLASTCLPDLFQAVEIDGEYFWDGGFIGNPLLFPLIDGTTTNDMLLVQINALQIDKLPTTAREIQDRVNEISFNSSLMWEMRIFNQKDKLVDHGYEFDGKLRKVYFHALNADAAIGHLQLSSKYNIDPRFLRYLKIQGRRYAEHWLQKNYENIGMKTTVDIEEMFL